MNSSTPPDSLESQNESRDSAIGGMQLTEEFRDWFGRSQVVSSDGSPLAVYHGTLAEDDFDRFHVSDFFESGQFGKGVNFTSSHSDAKKYASPNIEINHDLGPKAEHLAQIVSGERGGEKFSQAYREAKKTLGAGKAEGRVISAYLSMERPLVISKDKLSVPERVFMLAAVEADLDSDCAQRLFAAFNRSKDGVEQFDAVSRFKGTKIYRQIASIMNRDGLIIDPIMAPKSGGATHYLILDPQQICRIDRGALEINSEDKVAPAMKLPRAFRP